MFLKCSMFVVHGIGTCGRFSKYSVKLNTGVSNNISYIKVVLQGKYYTVKQMLG